VKADVKNTQRHSVVHCEGSAHRAYEQDLIAEEPLSIHIEGKPYSVIMRTPGEEVSHVAGFCLAEGLVDEPEDFAAVGYCNEPGSNMATVSLQPARREKVEPLLKRRGFISQTSCGICGKELIKDLCQNLVPIADNLKINVREALECVGQLPLHQKLYEKTRGSHAALVFDSKLQLLAMAEDVGRHNALDKVIGKVFMDGRLASACLAVLSSRISYELVQKAARAQLAIVLGMSRPTALAVELGQSVNMTLACPDKQNGLLVFCGKERLNGE
jgi:FdhD protein